MPSKTELDIDKSSKDVRQNQWRLLQAFKNVSSIQLNEENEEYREDVDELRQQLWNLKNKLGEENPFTVEDDITAVEEELV